MNNLNYIAHVLLSSKYRLVYYFTIIFLIYFTFYSDKIVYCMTNDNDNGSEISSLCDFDHIFDFGNPNIVETPTVAEAKEPIRPSHQVIALANEIKSFAGTQIPLLEQIAEQKKTIEALENKLYRFIMKDLGGTNAYRTENRVGAIGNAIGFPLEEVTRFKKAYPSELKNTYERLVEEALKPVEVPQTKYYTYSPFEDYERRLREEATKKR